MASHSGQVLVMTSEQRSRTKFGWANGIALAALVVAAVGFGFSVYERRDDRRSEQRKADHLAFEVGYNLGIQYACLHWSTAPARCQDDIWVRVAETLLEELGGRPPIQAHDKSALISSCDEISQFLVAMHGNEAADYFMLGRAVGNVHFAAGHRDDLTRGTNTEYVRLFDEGLVHVTVETNKLMKTLAPHIELAPKHGGGVLQGEDVSTALTQINEFFKN